MAERLSAESVAEIGRLAAAGMLRNEIARRVGVAAATVTKYAPPGAFDRSDTHAAVKARQLDAAGRRATLADNLLADAERLRAQLWEPTVVFAFGGRDNTYAEKHIPEPTPEAKRALMATLATAVDRHLRLVDHDTGDGVDTARTLLHGFMDAVALRAAQITDPDTPA